MSTPPIKFAQVVVARPFILVEFDYVGQTAVGIKERREAARGEKLKLERIFAREMVSAGKAVPAGSDEAVAILAETPKAAASKAEATKAA